MYKVVFVFVSVSGLYKYVFKRHAAGPWPFSGDAITVSPVYHSLFVTQLLSFVGKFNCSESQMSV